MQDFIRENTGFIGPDTAEQVSGPSAYTTLRAQGLMLAGLSDAGQGYFMHRSRLPHGHLLVTLGGAGRVWVEGRWVESAEGSAYISPPHVPSAFETFPEHCWQFAWVFTLHNEHMANLEFSFASSVLVPVDPQPLATAIEGLFHESVGQADGRLLDDWARLVRAYTIRIIQPPPSHRVDPLARLWAEVDARPGAEWTLTKLTDLACMSAETLRKLSLSYHGRSPMAQVTYLRMRRADSLLQSTAEKLAVIAQRVGYENVFAFSTAFRRVYGVPPSSRRQNMG